MKKVLSILLALVLVLSLSTVAFADEKADEITYTPTTAKEVKEQITKTYANNTVLTDTLTFESTAYSTNPSNEELNVTALNYDSTKANNYVTFTIPSLSKAGIYEWDIKETGSKTVGVTTTSNTIHVIVLVGYDNSNNEHKLVIENTTSYIYKPSTKDKVNNFENTLETGSFTINKAVTGNMAREDVKFTFNVTLTVPEGKSIGSNITVGGQSVSPSAWTNGVYTTTVTIDARETYTISNVPRDVVVTVKEDQSTDKMNGYTYVNTKLDNTVQKNDDGNNADGASFTMEKDGNHAVVVTNNKGTEIATGIALDSMPYFLMLAVACMGLVFFTMKKRANREY